MKTLSCFLSFRISNGNLSGKKNRTYVIIFVVQLPAARNDLLVLIYALFLLVPSPLDVNASTHT